MFRSWFYSLLLASAGGWREAFAMQLCDTPCCRGGVPTEPSSRHFATLNCLLEELLHR